MVAAIPWYTMVNYHGNTMVNKPVVVKADQSASKGVRYKYGRNLNLGSKGSLKIKNPKY